MIEMQESQSARALKTFQSGRDESLNTLQINQIAAHEIKSVIESLSSPEKMDLIIRKAEIDFYRGETTPF